MFFCYYILRPAETKFDGLTVWAFEKSFALSKVGSPSHQK
jgi:hypothetical protein